MFRKELLAVQDRRFLWAYFLIPGLFAAFALWQVTYSLSVAAAKPTAPVAEALMLQSLATITLPLGWFGLVFGAVHAVARLREATYIPWRFTNITGAVLARCLSFIFGVLLVSWAFLAFIFSSSSIVVPEWSLIISAVFRLVLFAVASTIIGVAAGAAIPNISLAVLAALGFQGLATFGLRYLATSVTAWAVLASPVDNFLAWASGYRIDLIPVWQAATFWLIWFSLFIGIFWLIYRYRTKSDA